MVALREDPLSATAQRRLWALAEILLPRKRTGDFNQAMMELGSTVCTVRHPACHRCPLAALCPTYSRQLQDRIPPAKRKAQTVPVREAALVIRCDGRILIRRSMTGERWAGLWDFPRFELSAARGAALTRELAARALEATGITVTPPRHFATFKHGVTRYRITLSCYETSCARPTAAKDHLAWVTPHEARTYPMSVAGRKISQMLS
jgi:A/G-specific adenine glycosylase